MTVTIGIIKKGNTPFRMARTSAVVAPNDPRSGINTSIYGGGGQLWKKR